jgi:hypothetical protein
MYQTYDFKKEVDTHIDKKILIELKSKSAAFKNYLSKLKIFQLDERITKSHDLFQEVYFIFIKSSAVFVAKQIGEERFDHIEVVGGLKFVRKLKLNKIFK